MHNKKSDIVLFGCGEIGCNVLHLVGEENILCFCDNNYTLQGSTRWGKQVFSLQQLKENFDNFIIIICIRISKVYQIVSQLEEEKIIDYWIYPIIQQDVLELPVDKLLQFLQDRDTMFRSRTEFYRNKISELEQQLNFMKKHTDIRMVRPATGALRKGQLDLVDFGNFICQVLAFLQIRPFLCGGNLLGYVRHNGFIPWDDDMDLELIREEYDRLYDYCIAQKDENGFIVMQYGDRVEKVKFVEHYNRLALIQETSDMPRIVEFFSLDYYANDYSYDSFRRDAKKIHTKVYSIKNEKDKIKYVREEMKKNPSIVKKSNSIFYGFDNMESIRPYDIGKMMPEEIVFPLRQVKFEDRQFWIPNNPEEFLSYNFEDIWSFPDDVGIQRHIKMLAD